MRTIPILFVLVASLPVAPLRGEVIDHTRVAGVDSLPQPVMDAIGQQTWFFTHASVGENMLEGMRALHASNPQRYQLVTSAVSFSSDLQRAISPPASTTPGTIYECLRGNPGWDAKFPIFTDSVAQSGWHAPAAGICMDKLCFVDQDAVARAYINTMTALEAAYPGTRFVWCTMPLMNMEDANNIKRNDYNQAVRDYCTARNRLLFDIADIEAWTPDGVEHTFSSGGKTYQTLYNGYSVYVDDGHLNAAGAERVAKGWYALAAATAVPEPSTLGLLGSLGTVLLGWAGYRLSRSPMNRRIP